MKTILRDNTATNAMEAKNIVDSFLNSLTNEDCFKLMSSSMTFDKIHVMPHNIAYAIGASAYYYGAECKQFCSEHISLNILERGFKHIKTLKS